MKYFLTGSISLVIGIALGVGGLFFYNKYQTKELEKGITIEIIEGEKGNIKHDKIKNYHDRIEFETISKKPGIIRTIIKKSAFCPKIYKNSLSFILYAPEISYGIEYRRQVFSRFHILAGVKIASNNVQGFLGTGVNF